MNDPTRDRKSDAALVAAARAGDRGAFGRLYERYAPMVHGVLLARVPPQDADDLLHEVFLSAMRRLSALRDLGAFGGWLAAIARNQATDHHRRGPREVPLFSESPARSGASGEAASGLSSREHGAIGGVTRDSQVDALAVLEIIRSLPEAYRETLVLRLVEGLTGPEIAARCGMTHASVRVNLHRGMRQLRQRLGLENDDA